MVSNVSLNYVSAYDAIKNSVSSALKSKIENRKLFHNDILTIARSVLVKEDGDGLFSIKKRVQDRNVEVSLKQQDLIRRICLLEQSRAEVQIVRREKKQKEESQLKISKVEDLFYIGAPVELLGLVAEYIPETASAIIDFINNKKPIPQYLKNNLKHLNLGIEDLSLEIFKVIISEFKNLKSIELPECADDSYLEALKILPKLEGLNLYCCRDVTDAGINKAILWFTGLKYLNLGYSSVTDNGLVNIDHLAASLEILNLKHTKITGKFLSNVRKDLEVLKRLDLSSCLIFEESNLRYIIDKLLVIEELVMLSMNLTDKGVGYIFKGMQKLESLELQCEGDCNKVLKQIAEECPNLKKLHIHFCKNMSEVGIYDIFECCTNLQELSVYASNVDDRWFESINKKPRKLSKLVLFFCSRVTDKGIESLSKGCPDLRSISLLKCPEITDLGVLHLTHGVKQLEEFVLKNNDNISSKSLDGILVWRDTLRMLEIRGCMGIDKGALSHLSSGLLSHKTHILTDN